MIYGVSPSYQEKEVTHYCFGVCGGILCAGIDGGDVLGGMFPCRHEDCPHEDKCSPVIGDIQGEPIKVRKLKAVSR